MRRLLSIALTLIVGPLLGRTVAVAGGVIGVLGFAGASELRGQSVAPPPARGVTQQDTTRRDSTSQSTSQRSNDLFGDLGDLGISLDARMESRAQRLRNDRCTSQQLSIPGNSCRSAPILPEFDFQFNVRSAGVVADRLHVDVDYDSQRQFDASNTLSIQYLGKPGARLQRVEVGNVTFQPPTSRFITAGIPSGNYGVQATGKIGAMSFSSIFAQQKGNISRDNVFTVGEHTQQHVERVIEDVQVEQRRFFFTIDPRTLVGYPNVDLLNRPMLDRLAAALPDSIRPTRLYVYRQLIGSANQNPKGPQLSVRGARNPTRQTYELLRENVDYYVDPSLLWIALVRPLSGSSERLAVAYEVSINGQPGRNINTGGTPDIEYTDQPQYANLLWEPELQPSNAAYFLREIKSAYRLGGEDLRRESLHVRIVTGTSGDQERPVDVSAGDTYLQVFGLAQPSNPAALDVDNRVWPRPNDPNFRAGFSTAPEPQSLLPDYFLFFPSVQPFSHSGLARPSANPANDTLYHYPNEYLYSPERPQTVYRMVVEYQSQGISGGQTIQLNTIQVRPNSERVVINGRPLKRHIDYEVDYDLGIITFSRPDTLFATPREVTVNYEENPLFTTTPTTILGLTSAFQLDNGQVAFTAISQRQKSSFNRPPLGLEAAGSIVAGVTSTLNWNATALSNALQKIPFARSSSPSQIGLQAELALSKPQPNAAGQAYIDSFEGSSDRAISLLESSWYFSSLPALGASFGGFGANIFTPARAATLAFQNNGLSATGGFPQFTIEQIDPSVRIAGAGVQPVEQLLWLTLYPLRVGGMPIKQRTGGQSPYAWSVGDRSMVGMTPSGRRWRSLRTVLNPTGQDLSRVENIEFFALVHADAAKTQYNPTLVMDFGEISENSLTFAPETLFVTPVISSTGSGTSANTNTIAIPDSTWRGKRLVGFDRLDSERDPVSRAFNAAENDKGLAGDVADTLVVVDRTGGVPFVSTQYKVPLCSQSVQKAQTLGDNRANCTVGNNRLDEEDIDLDGQLNIPSSSIDQEQLKRFVVDLSDRNNWTRVGRCFRQRDTTGVSAESDSLCWVQIKLNWQSPAEELNNPNERRMRAMRLTMITNGGLPDEAFTQIALARLRLVGAPWLKRSVEPLSGMAGDSSGVLGGFVITSVVGTLDSTSNLQYSSPPGVVEVPENRQSGYENTRIQVNEQALRIQTGLPGRQFRTFDRAEAYFRFPEGTKTFMGYRSLRLWMRGRGNGWGMQGELNGYIKIGRDENNFYMYRTPVNSGSSQSAWLPEVNVDLTRFQILRARLETMYLDQDAQSLQCTGVDLELIRRSGAPLGGNARRRAVCEGGYIVYSSDPTVTPPNLAGVQELAVGLVRVDSIPRGGNGIMPGDTLELWVNDIRLSDVVDDLGFAGELGLAVKAGDLADLRLNLSRRDPNFRQLNEAPTFMTSNVVNLGTTLHLERVLPERWGISLPLTIDYSGTGVEQLFLNKTDVRASGISGLRNPSDHRTSYSMALRRITPLNDVWYAPLANGLMLSGSWVSGSSQSSFQELSNSSYTVRAGLVLGNDMTVGAFNSSQSEDQQHFRWRPSSLRLTSSLVRSSTSVTSFGRAAMSPLDTGQVVGALRHEWQNLAVVVFRPLNGISADFTARQVLDLRDYRERRLSGEQPDSIDRGAVAERERIRFLGTDLGLERERSFTSALRFQPNLVNWFRPRADFMSSFMMNKDPNARVLLRTGDSTGFFRLPQRLGAINSLEVGTTIDLGSVIRGDIAQGGWRNFLSTAIAPIDIQWQQNLNSNYDNTILSHGYAYQMGFGGISSFRGLDNQLATAAGRMRRATAVGALNLPLSLRLQARVEDGTTEMWVMRSLDNRQSVIVSNRRVFPDYSLRWNWTPTRGGGISKIVSQLSLEGGIVASRNETTIPDGSGVVADRSQVDSRRVPFSLSITWPALGDLITSARSSSESREDLRPGALINGTTDRQSFFVSRSFPLPKSWNTNSGRMRASASYDSERNFSTIAGYLSGPKPENSSIASPVVVLTNNGRRAFNINANTDLSDLLTFTLAASQVVNFDRAYNRQTTNTILSAVLQLRFFSGDMH